MVHARRVAVAFMTFAALGNATVESRPVAAQGPRSGCFRGRPLPLCRSFWIVEMQGESPLFQTTREVTFPGGSYELSTFDERLEWNLGYMTNLSPRFALGGALSAGTDGGSAFSGLKVRGRRWLNEQTSVELETGLLRREAGANGVTADARLNIGDYGAFYVRWDGVSVQGYSNPSQGYDDPGGFQQAVSVGAGLGTVPALIGTGALGIALVILISTVDWS